MTHDFLILGGGVGGLSAANHFADAGVRATLLESGTYPSHKICGEFISPEGLPILQKWGINPCVRIHRVKLVSGQMEWGMQLPLAAASLSRYLLDEALAKRAQDKGIEIQTHAQITHIAPPKKTGGLYTVTLNSGKTYSSSSLLISTGRLVDSLLGKQIPPSPRYIGVKAHFEGVETEDLVMHLAKRSYFGISPIGKGRVNVAGIIAATSEEMLHPQKTFTSMWNSRELQSVVNTLSSSSMAFPDWLIGTVPEFGVRIHPTWPGVYLIGDAAGVIAPATGNGLAMSLTSGILAATYALKGQDIASLKGQDIAYRKQWKKEYQGRISRGMMLHRLFLSPQLVKTIPTIGRLFPFLPRYCFRATRGR